MEKDIEHQYRAEPVSPDHDLHYAGYDATNKFEVCSHEALVQQWPHQQNANFSFRLAAAPSSTKPPRSLAMSKRQKNMATSPVASSPAISSSLR